MSKYQREMALYVVLERALVSVCQSVPGRCWVSSPLLELRWSFAAVLPPCGLCLVATARWPEATLRRIVVTPCASARQITLTESHVTFQFDYLGGDEYVVTQKIIQVSGLVNSVSFS